MRRLSARSVVIGLATAAAVTALTVAPASAVSAAPTARTVSPPRVTSTELLLNGDRILPIGPHAYGVLRAGAGFAAATIAIRTPDATYEIPDAAFPYLGHGLDPSLFNVARLPRTDTLSVTISYQGAKAPALPGVFISHAAVGSATGYLTAASARVFGAALVRQFASDHATAAYGTDGLFANGTTVRLAGAPAARPRANPEFPMHTLTVHGTALNGRPDTGDTVTVLNMDSFAFFGSDVIGSLNFFYRGTTKFSVPAGHYLSLSWFNDLNSAGHPIVWRFVVSDFTVTGNTSIAVDERSATSAVTIGVPRPAVQQDLIWTLRFADHTGSVSSYVFGVNGIALYAKPGTLHVTAGSLRLTASSRLVSPATERSPYTYDVSFANPPNQISRQTFVATAANLAAVPTRYFSDVHELGGLLRYPVYAFNSGDIFFITLDSLTTPVQQTEYLSADSPTVYWETQYIASQALFGGGQSDSSRAYAPGRQATQDWNAYPLHSALNASVLGRADIYPTFLSAVRAADTLFFNILPFGDNTPGHSGTGYSPGTGVVPPGGITGSYVLDQNGKKIAGGNADLSTKGFASFFMKFKVTPSPAEFKLTLNASRAVKPYVLSTRTSTIWTWRSTAESGTVLPPGWVCPDFTRDCASQALMTLDYKVAGLGVTGIASAGAQVVKLTVGHQQVAPAAPIAGLIASFSVNGGETWQAASVKGSGATWYAAFNAPAGSEVSLRVSATDRVHGAITETVLNAYAITGSAATASYRSPACAKARTGYFSCFLLYSPVSQAGPRGWGANSIQKAYKLPVKRTGGTVAVVEFLDTPKLESYLNTYRKQYGLGPCTTANGCFRKVNQYGQTSPLPPSGIRTGADLEATLDADMVSAACPKCHILVVEANSGKFSDAATAENTAARLGAVVISNSFGARENGYLQTFARAFNHPGHTTVVASGDYGYTAANFPANLTTVTAVGGTALSTAHNARGYSETVWNTPGLGAGSSGCSAYVAKPTWQHDIHCGGRTVADVSAVAFDVAVYNTDYVRVGWLPVAGTSASAPLVAGIYALAGNAATVTPGSVYAARPGSFFDITTGNNDWWSRTRGRACGFDYLCVAKPGYDAPTGLGTPDGIGGF